MSLDNLPFVHAFLRRRDAVCGGEWVPVWERNYIWLRSLKFVES